jgi:hypothetical protein
MLDLLGGELPPDEAVLLRAHVDGCEACRRDRAQLTGAMQLARRLPLESPSPAVRAALVARARTATSGLRANPSTGDRSTPEDPRGFARFVAWVSGFVLGPQVAMAMVLLLMVGVGLFYLPGLRRDRAVEGGAIVNADPGEEAGPSTTIQPAAPLDLRLDTRTNRLQPAGEGGERQVAASTRTPSGEATPADAEENAAAARMEAAPSATLVAGTVTEPSPAEQADDARPEPPPVRAQLAARASSSAVETEETDRVAAFPAAPMVADEGEGLAVRAPAQAAERYDDAAQARSAPVVIAESNSVPGRRARNPEVQASPSAPQPVPARAPTFDVGRSAGGLASGSMGAAPTPMAGGAAPIPAGGSYVARGPATLHATARTQAQGGQVRAAIAGYEALLAAHPSYERAAEAMLELAELHRRNGDLASARTWLTRAERSPAFAARARAARARIDAPERAPADAPAATAAEPR